MEDSFVKRLNEENMRSTAGVSRQLFEHVYQRYGGAGTPFSQRSVHLIVVLTVFDAAACRYMLYHVLYYLKTYPTLRHLSVVLQKPDIRSYRKTLHRRIVYLGERMQELLREAWIERHTRPNPVQSLFPGVSSILDSFPIRGVLDRACNRFDA